MTLAPPLSLYHRTISHPTGAIDAIPGYFLGLKSQEIVTARSPGILELWRPDRQTGKLVRVIRQNTFSIIRALAAFRLATREYLAVTLDLGNIAILEVRDSAFVACNVEAYGKTGIRRLTPGAYLVADPKGRAVMAVAFEKNKMVWTVGREGEKVTVSSPLEANRGKVLTFGAVGVDVGYDNPLFATLECDYGSALALRMLTFYTLDLGLNHILLTASYPVPPSASHLTALPGAPDGPGGVLVFSEGSVQFFSPAGPSPAVPLPRRVGFAPIAIVAAVAHKIKGDFFVLAQSSLGDLYKITGSTTLTVRYFDTVPVCTALVILRAGFLYAETESGPKLLYQFEGLGEEDASTLTPKDPTFTPTDLANLALVDVVECLNPITTALRDGPTVLAFTGKGSASSLAKKVVRGLEVLELVSSPLPETATRVWTTRLTLTDRYDQYLVLSFSASTLVLSIGETVEEVTDSGLLVTVPTLAIQQLGNTALVQVHAHGLRHLQNGRLTEWFPPAGVRVVAASTTRFQVVVALSSRELVYFEADDEDTLNEYDERVTLTETITAVALGPEEAGLRRARFLAVGTADALVRVFATERLEPLAMQTLAAAPCSLRILTLDTVYLHIGLVSGVYIRTTIDSLTGQLSDSRTHYLGPGPVVMAAAAVNDEAAVLALCTRTWMGRMAPSGFLLAPLVYPALADACSFSSEDCPKGLVGIHGNAVSIFTMVDVENDIHVEVQALEATPRGVVRVDEMVYVVGSHLVRDASDQDEKSFNQEEKSTSNQDEESTSNQEEDSTSNQPDESTSSQPEDSTSNRLAVGGGWKSCIQALGPSLVPAQTITLAANLAALSITACRFGRREGTFVVVGVKQTAGGMTASAAFLHTYRIGPEGLEFVHATELDSAPLAMVPFQGRLLVGMGTTLRVYDMGQRQLLRKTSTTLSGLTQIVRLETQGLRVVVGDGRQSLTFCVYRPRENVFVAVADDVVPRATTAMTMLDYETVMGGDKFGNVWVVRCPPHASRLAEDSEHGFLDTEPPFLNGAPHRLLMLCHFHLHDIPTSLTRGPMTPGGADTVVYTGIQGLVGTLQPLATRHDVEFFTKLETLIRNVFVSVTGREHLVFRGYYAPVKGVVDGDLVEMFATLGPHREKIAATMDRTVKEVERKIEAMRTQ